MTTIKLTARHEDAISHINSGLEDLVTDEMKQQLEQAGLAEKFNGQWQITPKGADLLLYRVKIVQGRLVQV